MSRHFATVGERQVHYRRLGSGPAVLLLHQSPTSSAELEPLMRRVARRFTAIAPDMPGYGASDPGSGSPLTIEGLAGQVAALMDELGIDTAAVYGFHTGASVAVSLARRHPERVTVALCEGLLCLDADERREMSSRYVEPFVPRFDGGHLAWLWTRLKDQSLFFPWYERTGAARLDLDGTLPEGLAAAARDWLRAGVRYGDAYAAAIAYDPRADLAFVRTPLEVLCRTGDPLAAHLPRLMPLASSIAVHRFDSAAEGGDLIERALVRHAPHRPAPPPVPTRPLAQRVWQSYVPSQGAQLRVQQCGCGPARAAVVQHDAYSSLRACRRLVGDLGVDRPALAIELPGHGETAWVEGCDADGLSSVASLVRGALQSLGATDCDLIGWGAGAALQVELARGRPALAASLTLIAAVDVSLDPPLQTALLASYSAPPADSYGGHLLRAWHEVRDHLLFFPWYERRRRWALEGPPRLEPEFLQARTVDAVLAGGAGVALRQAELRYPLRSRLREQPRAARHAAPSWEPRCAHSCGLAGSSGAFAALSRDPEHWIATLKSLMQSEPP